MASEHFRAQIIGAGRSVVASAAYRHRAPMLDNSLGKSFDYSAKQDLVHEEIALPENAPQWVRDLVQGSVAAGSERLWNEVVSYEKRADAQHAREIVIGLPIELSKEQNIALMREFITEQILPKGLIADWVYHDAPGNPHVHLMHTMRPAEERGFGSKVTPVRDSNGELIRIGERKQIVYQTVIGGRDGLKDWRNAWGEVANRHLALAGHEVRVDMRSYKERGIDLVPTTHLGPGGTAVQRKIGESQAWSAREAARFETADQIMEKPGELLKLVSGERSTFDERDLAKTLHRFIDDPETFANVRAKVMASDELVEVRGRIVDPQTHAVLTQPIYSTRKMVRVEHDMAVAADRLQARGRFGVKAKTVAAGIRAVETKDLLRPFTFDAEQVAAVEHVTGKSGIAAVVGYAGAGKSTLLEAANHAWVTEGRRVYGAALAGKAAAEGRALKGDELLVLAHTNADVLALNAGIRDVMKAEGALTDERAFVTERGTRQFAVGDRAIFLKNERFEEKLAPELGRQQVKNGMLGTVIATPSDNGEDLLRVRLDNGREVAFNENTYRNVDHGYAATIHKSQGVTVDRVFVMASKSMDQHLSYVAMSRHRHQVTLYAPQSEFKDFDRLAETLGRSGAKSTTLDFANEAGYREAVDAFAARRGIETLNSIAPAFAAFVERQTAWVAAKRDQLASLWGRAGGALSATRDRTQQQDVALQTAEPAIAQPAAPVVPVTREGTGFAAVTSFSRSIEADAHQALVQSPDWQHRLALMQPLIERIYRNPAEASAALGAAAADMTTDPRRLAKTIAGRPQAFGPMRGGDSLVAGQSGRGERSDALAATAELAVHGRSLAQSYRRDRGAAITTEAERRVAMQTVVPDLSEKARSRLQELEAVRAAAGLDAYRDATRMVMKDKEIAQELATVAAAIADRFGTKAFTVRAGEDEKQRVLQRVPAVEREHLTKVSEELAGIRRFGGEFSFVERMTAARAEVQVPADTKQTIAAPEAGASVPAAEVPPEAVKAEAVPDVQAVAAVAAMAAVAVETVVKAVPAEVAKVSQAQTESKAPDKAAVAQAAEPAAPLFAAVTSFADSIEAAARANARTSPGYAQEIDKLAQVAATIWRDAPEAVARIELTVATTAEPGKLEAALKADPSRAGPLRGSDRILDRLSAAGFERKVAMQALPAALAAIRMAEHTYKTTLAHELVVEKAVRTRMSVEIPALSAAGQAALDRITASKNQEHSQYRAVVLALPPEVKAEFQALNDALDKRFGPNAFKNDTKGLDRYVSASQRATLGDLKDGLTTVQRAVETSVAQKHESERIQKNLSQSAGMRR